MRLTKAAARAQRRRDWNICVQWHFLAERRQLELDAERTEQRMRRRRVRSIGKVAARAATEMLAARYRLGATRIRQIVHEEQADAWNRAQAHRRQATVLVSAFAAAESHEERARLVDAADPSSRIASRRIRFRQKRLRDKLAKRRKRRIARTERRRT